MYNYKVQGKVWFRLKKKKKNVKSAIISFLLLLLRNNSFSFSSQSERNFMMWSLRKITNPVNRLDPGLRNKEGKKAKIIQQCVSSSRRRRSVVCNISPDSSTFGTGKKTKIRVDSTYFFFGNSMIQHWYFEWNIYPQFFLF